MFTFQEVTPYVQQGYTAAEVLTFFAAAGALITVIGGAIVNIVVAYRTNAKVDAAAIKTDAVLVKVEEVHKSTNGGLSEVKAELTTSNALNTELRDIITDLKAEREKTAVATALKTPVPERARSGRAGDDPLVKIEENTAQTAENTKTKT